MFIGMRVIHLLQGPDACFKSKCGASGAGLGIGCPVYCSSLELGLRSGLV